MRMYSLHGKSMLALKQLRDLVAVNPDLTVEEKKANLKAIDSKLNPSASIEQAKVDMVKEILSDELDEASFLLAIKLSEEL